MDKQKVFCPLPWIHFSTHVDGSVRMCCGGAYVKNISAKTATLDDIFNSPVYKKIRKQMMNNEKPIECNWCWKEERLLARSYRFGAYWEHRDRIYDKAIEHTQQDGTIDIDVISPEYLDLRFSNKCTQKCRSCGPLSSNLWYDDNVKLAKEAPKLNQNYLMEYGQLINLTKNKQIFLNSESYKDYFSDWGVSFNKDLNRHITHVKKLYFAGGEPLIQQSMWELLKTCIDSDVAKNIDVQYSSNISTIPSYAYDIWKHFKSVHIYASIDGYSSGYEYLRHPTKWRQIVKNLKKLDSSNAVSVSFSPIISIFNIFNIAELQAWILEQNFKNIKSEIRLGFVNSPKYLDINLFSDLARQKIINFYEKFIHQQDNPEIINQFNLIKNYLINSTLPFDSETHRKIFFDTTRELDLIRSESFKDTFSEVYELMEKTV